MAYVPAEVSQDERQYQPEKKPGGKPDHELGSPLSPNRNWKGEIPGGQAQIFLFTERNAPGKQSHKRDVKSDRQRKDKFGKICMCQLQKQQNAGEHPKGREYSCYDE